MAPLHSLAKLESCAESNEGREGLKGNGAGEVVKGSILLLRQTDGPH